jgi:hypothetical protein
MGMNHAQRDREVCIAPGRDRRDGVLVPAYLDRPLDGRPRERDVMQPLLGRDRRGPAQPQRAPDQPGGEQQPA